MARKRANDALLRNRRQTKQLRLDSKRKMPKKGTKITVHYDDKHKDRLDQIKATMERYGLKVEFRKLKSEKVKKK